MWKINVELPGTIIYINLNIDHHVRKICTKAKEKLTFPGEVWDFLSLKKFILFKFTHYLWI